MAVHGWRDVLRAAGRVLTFRATADDYDRFGLEHLFFGLGTTWIVGIGRWWDDPKAEVWQQTGLGSIAYVLFLSFILWLVVLPLKARRWSYVHVLTFVTLTASPAILYAIPVERFMPMKVAAHVNLAFLCVVATWRVALLVVYMRRQADLPWWLVATTTLLPLASIVIALSIMNLATGVVEIMGGIRDETANDAAAGVVLGLGFLAYVAFIPLTIAYIVGVVIRRRQHAAASDQRNDVNPS